MSNMTYEDMTASVRELQKTARYMKKALCKLLRDTGWHIDDIAHAMRLPKATAWRWATGYDEKRAAKKHAEEAQI